MGLSAKRGGMVYVPRIALIALEDRKKNLNIHSTSEAFNVLVDDAEWGRAVKGIREGLLKGKLINKAKY